MGHALDFKPLFIFVLDRVVWNCVCDILYIFVITLEIASRGHASLDERSRLPACDGCVATCSFLGHVYLLFCFHYTLLMSVDTMDRPFLLISLVLKPDECE